MTALPPSNDFTGSSITEGQFKTAITNLRAFLNDLFGSTGTIQSALNTLGSLGAQSVSKTAAYTVVVADRGKVIECNGTFSLNLTAAATLAAGFSFIVRNTGSGVITIDPNSSETIDGFSTKSLASGEWAIVYCTGSLFNTFGYSVPPEGGGVTLLGTVSAASGNSVSLTGLTLTNYKFLHIYFTGISLSGSAPANLYFSSNNANTGQGTISATLESATYHGFAAIDLSTGVLAMIRSGDLTNSLVGNITTSSTAVYFRWESTKTFDGAGGQFKIYGVK